MSRLALLVAGAFFMEFLDATIIVTALPTMAPDLGARAVDLHAGITAYLLTVAIFILPSGWMAERYGPRRVFTGAVLLFTGASVLCGLAGSAPAFVAARALQGVGGAMMVPVGRLVVLRTTAKPDLLRAIALLTWPALTAPLIGPPLGGFMAEHLSWRLIFFVNLPVGLAGAALALRLVPASAGAGEAGPQGAFDWRGFLLAAAASGFGLYALDLVGEAGRSVREALPPGLVALACGALLARHLRRHPRPILDRAPLAVDTFRAAFLGGTAIRVLISAVPFLLPLMFQLGLGLDAFHAGLLVLALFAGNIGIKPLTTPILRRLGFRTVLGANGAFQAATMLGCALVGPATPMPAIVALLVVSGASRSLQFTALNSLAFADVPARSMATANTLFSIAFQASLGLGVALGALLLRTGSLARGTADAPVLEDFHLAFAALAALTLAAALNHLRLAAAAGQAVSGRPRTGS
ncbi:putative transport protein HsrA [Methylobacterium crusticola]|uniref:Transport protein HsrA n=1 Tax=Methylobacterium crusticola TaxID=1697972 RepID=A0ABQ4R007_9HYPH|nr:MFS transporter [Methylobacterium crusticola]GJD50759.1 putative transport protein HsrA [Methylobacterium crusticola]